MEPVNVTGIACLRYLSANLKRDINFDALITPELQKEFAAALTEGIDQRALAVCFSCLERMRENAARMADGK